MQYSYIARITFAAIACNFVDPAIPFDRVTTSHILYFALFVLVSFIGQNLTFIANSMETPSKTMPFGYAGVVLGYLVDVYYFEESFNWLATVGIMLTSAGLLGKWFTHEDTQ